MTTITTPTHIKLTDENGDSFMIKVSDIEKAQKKEAGSDWGGSYYEPTFTSRDYTLLMAGTFSGLVKETVDEIFDACQPVVHVPIED